MLCDLTAAFCAQVPEVYTPLLERLLVVQIDSFPQYSERMQFACSRSILKVFVAVASKGPVLWSFISSVGMLSQQTLDSVANDLNSGFD